MIKGAYVLISSILGAVVYTVIITVCRDRMMEMIYSSLPVPADSAYSASSGGYADMITWALYLVPVVMVAFGFVYLALSGPRQESDSIPNYGGGARVWR